jgi:putative hemolysin
MIDILIIAILVGFNAFFSMAEVALISARKSRLQVEAKHGSRLAEMALRLMADTDKFLSTAQIGITVVSILTGIYTGAEMSDGLAQWLTTVGVPAGSAPFVAKTVILILATYLQCELGELFPKRIGIDLADTMAKLCTPPMLFFAALTRPLSWLMTVNTNALVHLFHLHKEDQRVTGEEIKSVIEEGAQTGGVAEVEQDIMERAMVMSDQTVEQLMTHRTEMVTLRLGMTSAAVEQVIHETPFGNYPVMADDDIDSVCGYVRLKDLVMQLGKPAFDLKASLQKPIYFPENMTVYRALEHLKKYGSNFGFVCDELGALQGIITFRDIFEGLVGTIPEKTETPDIIQRRDGKSWVVSGQCQFYDFVAYFDEEDLYDSDFNTLAGLILVLLDRIPAVGDECTWKTFHMRVIGMDGNRIDKVLVTRTTQDEETDG